MNSKIKLIGSWKVSKLPQLIERLQEIQESQLLDTRGALHGRGNYELAIQAKHLFVPHEAWVGMNEELRKKWTLKFFKFHPQSTLQTSTDGFLTIPSTSRIAKKTWAK